MKYKRLSNEELESLQDDFVKFLASNTVTASDWQQLKKEQPNHAEELIGLYSDIVFDKALENTKYIEKITPHQAQSIFCAEKEMILLGLYVPQDTPIDFTSFRTIREMLEYALDKKNAIEMMSGKKKYQLERNLEIFRELERGFVVVKESYLFEGLKLALSSPID